MPKPILIAVLLAAAASPLGAQPLTWIQSPVNGHWYAYDPSPKCWQAAEETATSLGGHLATIRSQAEQTWLDGQFFALCLNSFWIGLYQDAQAPDYFEPAGGWRWISGEPVTYLNWNAPWSPDELPGGSSRVNTIGCLHSNFGAWDDNLDCAPVGPRYGLYEVVSNDCDQNGVPDVVEGRDPIKHPEFGAGCAGHGGFTPHLSTTGCGAQLTLELTDATPQSTGLLLLGGFETSIPAAGPCHLLVTPVYPSVISFPTGGLPGVPGSGGLSVTITVSAGAPSATVKLQAFVADATMPWGYAASNGVSVSTH